MKQKITTSPFTPFVTCATLVALASLQAFAQQDDLRVDGQRLNGMMSHMKTFGGNRDGGSDRVAYSEHNKEALTWLAGQMQAAGLVTHIDVAGNLVGRRDGKVAGLAPIISGSHIDTVPNGGHYDGIVGSMAAIEVARSLHDAGIMLNHPIEIVMWSNEEGGKTGSRSLNGSIEEREFDLQSLGTRTLGDGIRFLGGDPDRIRDNIRAAGDAAALVELHVEQGAILDREGVSIGVVEGIVGIRRWTIAVEGFANHAGTTPMDQRQDALYAAALLIADVRKIITAEPGRQVGTVGRIDNAPNTPNVISGNVEMSLEIRDIDMDKIGRLYERISDRAAAIAAENDVRISIEQYYESPAAVADARIKQLIAANAEALGLSYMEMPSGAGHDAQSLKGIAPLGMIFVPSVLGVSHAPTELTHARDITNGANVLLHTMIGLDQLLTN